MIKIYVRNKPVFLIDKISGEAEDYLHRRSTLFIDELNEAGIDTMLQQMERDEFYAGVFLHSNLNELLDAFKKQLTVIQAAGGLVYTKAHQFLLIFRKGKWDLPKGKLDENEDLESCALREIKEETGANSLQLEKPLQVTYHTYYEGEKHILKESHWFLLKAKKQSALKPQTEEDIEKCEWASIKKVQSYMNNMHASVIDVVNTAFSVLNINQAKTPL